MTMMQMDGGIDDGCDDDGDDAILPVALDTKLQAPVATKGLLGQNMAPSPFDPAKLLGCKCMLTHKSDPLPSGGPPQFWRALWQG